MKHIDSLKFSWRKYFIFLLSLMFSLVQYISFYCCSSTTSSDKKQQFFYYHSFLFIKSKSPYSIDWLGTSSLNKGFFSVLFYKINKSIVTGFVIKISAAYILEWLICTLKRFATVCNHRPSEFSLRVIISVEVTYPSSLSTRDATWYAADFHFFLNLVTCETFFLL